MSGRLDGRMDRRTTECGKQLLNVVYVVYKIIRLKKLEIHSENMKKRK